MYLLSHLVNRNFPGKLKYNRNFFVFQVPTQIEGTFNKPKNKYYYANAKEV